MAHIQEKKPFEKYVEDIVMENQFPTNFGDTLYFAGCVYRYFDYFRNLFKKDYEIAIKKYNALRPVTTNYGLIPFEKVSSYIKKSEDQVKENLKKNLHIAQS